MDVPCRHLARAVKSDANGVDNVEFRAVVPVQKRATR